MREKYLLRKIEKLEREIAELKKAQRVAHVKGCGRLSLRYLFSRAHFIIGLIIVLLASSLIVYATSIEKPHTFISKD